MTEIDRLRVPGGKAETETMADRYLIWSHEHKAWWRAGGMGYATRIADAGRFSREDAMLICIRAMPGANHVLNELPVREMDVDAMIIAFEAMYGIDVGRDLWR